ncbi:tyrosine-type recombinase/integrase [Pectinatus frisingensis]|uniref:tyrosine-type recombinase/integrase n=1 Tax=Pectinatus frisingensis TaxID=865 RepID=UPI0018C575C9|nr:site-specific integrase [Pectinatus frisingensis]
MPKKNNRRINGEGTIYFTESKKLWQAMLTTPAGKRITKASKSRDIVQDWLNEQRLAAGRGTLIEPTGITVEQWFKEYLEVYAKNNVRPRSYERYRSLLDHAQPLYNLKLTAVLPAHLQALYNALIKDLSSQTVKHIHFCMSGAFKQAIVNNLIRVNPCTNVKTPSVKQEEVQIFTDDEIRLLLEEAKHHRNYPIVLLAYTTGMRLSEILALTVKDINLKTHTVDINKTVHRSMDKGIYFSEPKNKTSKRRITLPLEAIQCIKEHLKSISSINPDQQLFTTPDGRSYHASSYTCTIFKAIRHNTGIDKSFKCFRHTHASMLLRAGIPVQDVSRRLGHAKISTTLDIYSHCLPSADIIVADRISELMQNIR